LKPIQTLNIKHPISQVRYIPEKAIIGVIDEKNTFRMYDIENHSFKGGFKINLPPNRPLENSVAISPNGKYLAIAVSGKKKTTVWEVSTKKLLYTLGWHKGEVLACDFDNNDEYLLTGGMDGRAYLWSMNLGKMVASLPHHADYVQAVAFSKNNVWAATGSFDKLISITNISSLNISFRKKAHRAAVTQIKFLKNRMISGDKSGEIIVWNYLKGEVIKRLPNVADMVIDFDWDENEEYLFVITKDRNVYLYDIKNYEMVTERFLRISELPSSITYVPETGQLWIGSLKGSIYIFDLFENEKKLQEYLLKRDFSKAYELTIQNPFLKRSKYYAELEHTWDKMFNQAQKLLEKGEQARAKEILSLFLDVPSKRGIIQNILNDFSEFEKFKAAVLNRKYPLAYSLAATHPSFKDTVYYKKMEEEWKKLFHKAREMIKMNARDDMIREVLKPFRGVSEKTAIIQALFNDKQLYDLFKSKLQQKQFADFFALLNRYPFLYDTPEYEAAINYGEKLKEIANSELINGNYKKAMLLANTLEEFPSLKEEAKSIAQKAKVYSTFLSYLSQRDVDSIEKMVSDYPFLEESEDYLEYKKEVKERFKKAEEAATKGDAKTLKAILAPYFDSQIYKNRIKQLLKSAYLHELMPYIAKFAKTKNKALGEKIAKGIKNYIELFGVDNEIEDMINMMKQLKVKIPYDESSEPKNLSIEEFPDSIF